MHRSALRLEIRPAPASNDHEVKVWINDRDLLSERDVLGLDPDELFWPAPTLLPAAFPTTTRLARCLCGVIGCGDVSVRIEHEAPYILWTVDGVASTVQFLREDYEAEVLRAASDCSWETPDRTAARLVRANLSLVSEHLVRLGLRFEWASGRAQAGRFTVSLASVRGQVLLHVPFIGSPEALAARMLEVLRDYQGP